MEDYDNYEGKVTDAENYVFGGIAKELELPGPDLSIYLISKARFREKVSRYEDITTKQAQQIWSFLSSQMVKGYEMAQSGQVNSEPLTKENLYDVEIGRTGWDALTREIGLDEDVADELFSDCQLELTEMAEQRIEAQEEAEYKAQEQQEQAESEQGERGELSDEAIDQIIEDVRNDPKHPYNDPNASQEAHDKAVFGFNKLLEMKAGLIPKSWDAIDGYVQEHKTEKEQALKEQYGVSGNVYKSGDYHSASTPEREVEDGGADDIAQDSEGDEDNE